MNMNSTVVHKGIVRWFNTSLGYGFIQPADGGDDAFVHARALAAAGIDRLNEGDVVTFELWRNPKTGRMAANAVRVVSAQGE